MKDVHTEHCCVRHGCKYGKDDTCTVVQKVSTPSFNECEQGWLYDESCVRQPSLLELVNCDEELKTRIKRLTYISSVYYYLIEFCQSKQLNPDLNTFLEVIKTV